jgi:hypothetical protein
VRTASAIWSSELRVPAPKPIEIERMSASGAVPMTPAEPSWPRPAASEATIVPCSLLVPIGF